MPITDRGTAVQRFWAKIVVEDGPMDTPCWIWQGATTSDGYGKFRAEAGKSMWGVHRWALHTFVQELFDGEEVDHLCGVRNCACPDHLEAVDRAENMKRARKTHCKWGHEFNTENLYVSPRGHRQCRECVRIAQHKYRAKMRGQD